MTGPVRNWQFVSADWILPLDGFLNDPKLTDRSWFNLEDFYPALIAANRWNGKIGSGVGEGPLYSIPVLEESYIVAYRKDIFDQYNIKVPTTLEEMVEAARLVKKTPESLVSWPAARRVWLAWAPASSAASSRTPTASGTSSTTNAERHAPRSTRGEIHRHVDQHGPRKRSAELGQYAVVRRDGGLHGWSGGHDRRCGLLRRQLRRPQEVEGRRQGRLRADPGWPGRQGILGPLDLGAGHQQCDQEQDGGLALRGVGDRAAYPAQRDTSTIATTIRLARRSRTTRAFRRSWERGAAAAT